MSDQKPSALSAFIQAKPPKGPSSRAEYPAMASSMATTSSFLMNQKATAFGANASSSSSTSASSTSSSSSRPIGIGATQPGGGSGGGDTSSSSKRGNEMGFAFSAPAKQFIPPPRPSARPRLSSMAVPPMELPPSLSPSPQEELFAGASNDADDVDFTEGKGMTIGGKDPMNTSTGSVKSRDSLKQKEVPAIARSLTNNYLIDQLNGAAAATTGGDALARKDSIAFYSGVAPPLQMPAATSARELQEEEQLASMLGKSPTVFGILTGSFINDASPGLRNQSVNSGRVSSSNVSSKNSSDNSGAINNFKRHSDLYSPMKPTSTFSTPSPSSLSASSSSATSLASTQPTKASSSSSVDDDDLQFNINLDADTFDTDD